MSIQFSPPDISELEINEVAKALRSGWITTGPKTKLFEQKIAEYCGVHKAVCLNSATACLEMILRILGIGPGDEVITSAYTYTASASIIDHVGAKIVMVDTSVNSYEMDYSALENAITERTKAIIPVDIGGVMCDYDKIFEVVNRKAPLFTPTNDIQKCFNRVIVVADAAHSFGATYHGKKSGAVADFSSFSFHAVKNLTTAEGGALTWKSRDGLDDEALYTKFMLWTLHGQSKDALSKMKLGSWEYDIVYPAYKCNMTDITAAMGLAQIQRFDGLFVRRKKIYDTYKQILSDCDYESIDNSLHNSTGNYHLFLARVPNIDEAGRNSIIVKMAELGIACNVHFKPLPMMTAYKNLGFSIADYPNAYNQYMNEITLPMHTRLTDTDVKYVAESFRDIINGQKEKKSITETYTVSRVWADNLSEIKAIQKIHSDCGEMMFIDNGLLHWADQLSISYLKDLCLCKEVYIVRNLENEIVAFFTLSTNPNQYFDVNKKAVFIGKIAVQPKYWRKGIGTFCIDWVQTYAEEKDIKTIQTTAYNMSVGAVMFFEHFNFIKLYERSTKHFIVDCFEKTI